MSTLIGNAPNQVPTNADLGDLAYQDADYAIVGNLNIENSVAVTGAAVFSSNATINGNVITNDAVVTNNITVVSGNIFLQTTQVSSFSNAVVSKGYVDTASIIWGM